MQVDTLTIDAKVTDSFSRTLENLRDDLLQVGAAQELVDDETLDVDVDDSELDDLRRKLLTTAGMQSLSEITPTITPNLDTSNIPSTLLGGGADADSPSEDILSSLMGGGLDAPSPSGNADADVTADGSGIASVSDFSDITFDNEIENPRRRPRDPVDAPLVPNTLELQIDELRNTTPSEFSINEFPFEDVGDLLADRDQDEVRFDGMVDLRSPETFGSLDNVIDPDVGMFDERVSADNVRGLMENVMGFDAADEIEVGEMADVDADTFETMGGTTVSVSPEMFGEGVERDLRQAQNRALADRRRDERDRDDGRSLLRRTVSTITDTLPDVASIAENFDATLLNNIRASLVPLLLVFISSLPAAIAGLIGLAGAALSVAGAFGGILGLGALGIANAEGISLEDVIADLKAQFMDAFAPVAEALRPTVMAIVDSMGPFFDALAQSASGLRLLTDDLRAFTRSIQGAIVDGVRNLIQFADAVIPLLSDIADRFLNGSVFAALADILRETIVPLLFFADAIANLIPFIIDLSVGFLLVAGIITQVFSLFGRLASLFPGVAQALGVLIGALLTLITVQSLNIFLTKLFAETLILTKAKAIAQFIFGIGQSIAALLGYTGSTLAATAATIAFGVAAISVLTILTGGLLTAVGGLSLGFLNLGNAIGVSTDKLDEFARRAKRVNGMSVNSGSGPYTDFSEGGGTAVVDNSTTNIRAPDTETGTSVARTHDYTRRVDGQYTT